MTKRLIVIALVAILLLIPQTSYAQDKITVIDSSAQVIFPAALAFNIEAQSNTDITKVRIIYQVDKTNFAQVTSEAWADFTPAPIVKTQWVLDNRKVQLPVGAKIKYWWTVENRDGDKLTTPVEIVQFDDLRYSWKQLSQGQLNLFWYEGSQSAAEELMAASQTALDRLADDTGVYPDKPISMYVYANSKDLRGAMIFPREWTGGEARPEYNTLIIGLSSGNKEWDKNALAHELGHLVTHQMTYSPYGANLPLWLDEGLAMHAESKPDPHLQRYLEEASADNTLISVRSLSSPFSARVEEAYLSYAESQSIVEFLIQNYGRDKILHLLHTLKEGSTTDETLLEIYGFDQDGLDSLWRETLTAPEKPEEQQEKELQPVPISLLFSKLPSLT